MDTTKLPAVGVKGPNAARIADWSSMVQDLTFAAECCERVARFPDEPQEDEGGVVRRALWQAAVVSYYRSFDKRANGHFGPDRTPFPDEVFSTLTDAQRELHNDLKRTRNKHIGHRDDDREQAIVNVYLTPPEQGRGVECVGSLLMTMATPTREYVERVRDLAAYLAHHLNDGVGHARNFVLKAARAELDVLYEKVAARDA